MANLAVKKKIKPLGTARPPRRDLDVAHIKLQGDRGQVAELRRLISAGELDQTIEGASTLTLNVRDYDRKLLNSKLLETEAHLNLDNVEYNLAKVSHNGDELVLIFEETGVNLLRKYTSPKKANRASTTRAQFIQGLVKEVKERKIPFRCPEVNERQPIAAAEATASSGMDTTIGNDTFKPGKGTAGLTVKHKRANPHQLAMGKLIVETTRGRGGDAESCAGAVATAIQESTLTNIGYGDAAGPDSAGLYQQRPSMGWGTHAQVTNPVYAVNKFLDTYLAYRKKGQGWLSASHNTQHSGFPSAPAQWFSEGKAFTAAFGGSGGGYGSFLTGSSNFGSMTQTQPYEFSRGTADKREDSWTCSGRLADEVQWRRFMRAGTFWYVSDEWLIKQPVKFRLSEFTRGVVSLSFEHETRRESAAASLQVTTRRYSILPGDVIELYNEGAGNGVWLVSEVRRNLFSQVADVSLVRKRPKLKEPAASTTNVTVGGSLQDISGGQGVVGPAQAVRAYQAAEVASAQNWTYSQPRRNNQRPGGSADCSSGVSWVLNQAGIPIPGSMSPNAPTTVAYPGWGEPGPGKYFTIMVKPYGAEAHIWIRWNGIGSAWRFDTSSYGDRFTGSSGGRNRTTPRPTAGFTQRHWHGL